MVIQRLGAPRVARGFDLSGFRAAELQQAGTSVVIVENFAPYIYIGPGAVSRWETGFRGHVAKGDLSELHVEFGEPQDFSRDGNRVYFALPTTWTGRAGRRRFEESGVWSFVPVRVNNAWHVLSYAWGVMKLQASD